MSRGIHIKHECSSPELEGISLHYKGVEWDLKSSKQNVKNFTGLCEIHRNREKFEKINDLSSSYLYSTLADLKNIISGKKIRILAITNEPEKRKTSISKLKPHTPWGVIAMKIGLLAIPIFIGACLMLGMATMVYNLRILHLAAIGTNKVLAKSLLIKGSLLTSISGLALFKMADEMEYIYTQKIKKCGGFFNWIFKDTIKANSGFDESYLATCDLESKSWKLEKIYSRN